MRDIIGADAVAPPGARPLRPRAPGRPVADRDLRQILEAAPWAPTAQNMQGIEIIVVDDPATLAEIGAIRRDISAPFLREDYQQMSFSEDERRRRKTGVLTSMHPASWRSTEPEASAPAQEFARDVMRGCPVLIVVLDDPQTRAPASGGDALGIMSGGCPGLPRATQGRVWVPRRLPRRCAVGTMPARTARGRRLHAPEPLRRPARARGRVGGRGGADSQTIPSESGAGPCGPVSTAARGSR